MWAKVWSEAKITSLAEPGLGVGGEGGVAVSGEKITGLAELSQRPKVNVLVEAHVFYFHTDGVEADFFGGEMNIREGQAETGGGLRHKRPVKSQLELVVCSSQFRMAIHARNFVVDELELVVSFVTRKNEAVHHSSEAPGTGGVKVPTG